MAQHADKPTNPDPSNVATFDGPYTDPALTDQDGPFNEGETITTVPAKPTPGDTGEAITVYDIPTVDHEPGDQGASVIPDAPNSWEIEEKTVNAGTAHESTQFYSRDPYRVDGMPSQTYLRNQA